MKPAPFKQRTARAKPVDREGQEQAALMTEIKLRYPEVFAHLHHTPNGGHRAIAEAKRLKAQGTKAGIPDLQLTMARGGYFGLFIEFKATIQPAPVSPEQHACIGRLNGEGYLAVVCIGHFDAMECLRAYMALPPTVAA
ncbi:VRR-NUC domain-containing protein [Pseudomonas sp. RP23018S]|uniref:VRR-NUC domain-containing protein n=1 Tax=Pseudomonas sp. RP23018S TaxID=3096037 RepID=UPI002ACAD974|nr:VRR-NUC domain-containing protein [Pseudomonas sp. RP23018S]MDZ5601717.1 VRR-NUC domain-containing protein [Pseudomonas sp. RP23018S]